MNHDCDANCSFILIGQNAITFRVERDIKCGEEMTVFYAEHYFGEYNCECRCCSCERLQQGSFSVQQSEDEGESSLDENGNARRSIRKRKRVNYKGKPRHGHKQPIDTCLDYFVLGQVKRAKHAEALKETTNLELASPSSVDLSQSEQGETQKAKLFDLNWSRQELDKMSRVYNWMDAQSDLSDDDNDDCNDRSRVLRKGHLNEVRCCDYADEFGIVKESTDSLRCARCYRHYKIFNHEWPLRRPRRTYGRQKQKISSIPSPPSPLSPPLSLMSPTRTRSSLNSKPPSTLDRLKTLSDQGPRIIKAWSTLEVAPICIEAAAPTIHRLEETLLADEHKHTDLPKSTHYNKSQTKTERIHVLTEKRTILQQLLERYKELLDYQQNTNYQADQEETEVCVIDPSL
ncbi:hypothetical protein A0J61_10128 [Choanephora cucurbitarum]|uniref:SET domain-containing protein n=1 Tax=Choanephora cucurbitarum TaxID=101091 RepID=A0A1C7MZH5_9FUNG|nr:hypothetical protein A0J61_10128 [Choanephora cucurbitarum]